MKVTDAQAAALRAYLAGDLELHQELLAQLDREEAASGYAALLPAAFCVAADRRFSGGRDADLIEFVASVRSRSGQLARDIDPRTAERLIRAVYTDEQISDIDRTTRVATQFLLLAALIVEENLDDNGLDALLAEARKLADSWLS